jgi:hypothetical protein
MKMISTRNLLSFLVAVCLLAELSSAFAQKATNAHRIRFTHGQTKAVVRGELKPYTRHIYRLSARQRQRMTVRLQTPQDDIVFWIQSRKSIPQRNKYILEGIDKGGATDWTGELPLTGEYEIHVSNPPISDHEIKRTISYKLEVEIR